MALPYPIVAGQTACQEPVDQNLMDSIRLNLDYLDSQLGASGGGQHAFVVNGNLNEFETTFLKRMDEIHTGEAAVFGFIKATLKKSGTSGSMIIDLRRHQNPKTPITGIENQYKAATQDISRVSASLSTQTIARSQTQISTQSIARAKSAINVNSIIRVQGGYMRYNLASAPDADWQVGKSVTFSSCTDAANNVTATILEINQSGYPSIVISNGAGVAQTGAAGQADINLWSYNFSNPVSSDYATGELALFASHTSSANDGSLEVYKINQAGNNIWIYNASGVAQGGAAGNANVNRFAYAFPGAPDSTAYVVGEKFNASGHTSALNDGNFPIVAIGATSLTVYNATGTTQGGAAGTVVPNRWVYTFLTDPAASVAVDDRFRLTGHTNAGNNISEATVVEVKRGGLNNLVFYNVNGATQASVVGSAISWRKLIKFAADQSATYTTDSMIEIIGTSDVVYELDDDAWGYEVLQVNRGGGSNYNVVIEEELGDEQLSPAGWVCLEHKSILSAPLTIDADMVSLEENRMIFETATGFVAGTVPLNTQIGLYIENNMEGEPTDLTVKLS
jgi:hypothetical protein